jgi:DNA-binding CsgD family transcriptional regulator
MRRVHPRVTCRLAAVLVGRDRERAIVDHLLVEARGGRAGVLAVVGEAGVGKSALLQDAESRASDMTVLRARGVQSEARIPFAGLLELLRPALGHLDGLSKPQREALEGALALRPARARDRFAIGAATLSLLAAHAETAPALVLVDDVHWLDGSSADALLFACRRLAADRVAVVLAARSGETSFLDGSDLPTLRLEGIDRTAAGALLLERADVFLPNNLLDRLHHETGGNPLALVELAGHVDAVSADTPLHTPLAVVTSLTNVYLERCAALPESVRNALLLAAVNDTGDLRLLAKAAPVAGVELQDLKSAEAAGLVTVSDDRLEFRHPLVRSAVYAGATPARRRAMHRALADSLPDVDSDRRAWHLALAALGPDETACAALEQAGQRARERSAYDEASRAFERAASLAIDDERQSRLLYAAADTAWLAGLASRATPLLDKARRDGGADELIVAIDHLRGHIATRLGSVSEGQRILLEGAERAARFDRDRAVVMLAEAVYAAFYAGDALGMQRAAAHIASLGDSSNYERQTAFFAAIAQGMALIFSGQGERGGAALVRQAVALVEGSDELSDDPRLLTWVAMGPIWLRESEAGRALVDRTVEAARQQSVVGVLPFLLSHIGVGQAATDRWAEAEASFHEAITLARDTGQRTDLAFALARLALLEARQGLEPECRAHAGEALGLGQQMELGLTEIWAYAALADLELGLGHAAAAMSHFDQQRRALSQHGVGDVDLSPEPELIELLLRQGRQGEAVTRLEAFEHDARAKGQPWSLARASRCRGLLAPDSELDRRFGDAIAYHEKTPDLFEAARTRLAYGSRLRRARRRVRAREELRMALEVFDRLGAAPWSDMAQSELAATGETARRRDPSTRHKLTPQELQIALLLAAGRTSREAAATLFLSPKTIEYHLRSVYRKLGIGSREELAVAMSETPPSAWARHSSPDP